jgi:hypothetical protein
MKRLMAVIGLVGVGMLGTGCHLHGGMGGFHGALHVPVAPVVATAANVAVTAAIVGTAVALATPHDAHVHWESCGCQRRWHEGRWVYWYGGWWEYHDPASGYWYHY